MIALHAPVELRRRLVAAPRLKEPPHRLVVAALRALDLGGGESAELAFLVPDHLDRGHAREFLLCRLGDAPAGLVAVSAVVAQVGDRDFLAALDLLQLQPGAALWTELQPDPPPRAFWTLT